MQETITINSIGDIVDTLQYLLDNKIDGPNPQIIVQKLPNFELYLRGDKFNNSLTPTVMGGIIELQQAIYRSYVIARYGNDNLRQLTPSERESLEFKVIVTEGSTEVSLSLLDIAKKLLELISDMNTTQKYTVILLTLALIGAGVGWLFYSSYLDHENVKIEANKEMVIERERTKQAADAQKNIIKAVEVTLGSENTKGQEDTLIKSSDIRTLSITPDEPEIYNTIIDSKSKEVTANASNTQEFYLKALKPQNEELMAVISKAKASSPAAKLVAQRTEESMRKLITSTSSADFVRFNNQFEASGQTMKSIGTKQPVESERVVLNGLFRILNVDTKSTEFMQARIRAVDAKYPDFNATFTDTSLSKDKQNQLTAALTSYHPIDLSIEAKRKQGKLTDALITQVRQIDTTTSFKAESLET